MKKFLRFFAAGDVTVSNDAASGSGIKVTRLIRADGAKSMPSVVSTTTVAAAGNTVAAALAVGESILVERSDVTQSVAKDCMQLKTKETFSA